MTLKRKILESDQLVISSFFSGACYVAFLFGVFLSIGENFGVVGFNTMALLAVVSIIITVLIKDRVPIRKYALKCSIVFGALAAGAAMSAIVQGGISMVILIDYLKVAVYPLLFFVCFYNLREKSIPAYISISIGYGFFNLVFNSYVFLGVGGGGIGTAERIIVSPLNGEVIRATGASVSLIPLCLVGFFIYQTRVVTIRLVLFILCFSGILFAIYVGSRGLVYSVFPYFLLYLSVNSLKERKGALSLGLSLVVLLSLVSSLLTSEGIRDVFNQRILDRFSGEGITDATFSNRTYYWEYGFEKALASPMGKGFVDMDDLTGLSTHNAFIEIWVSYGIATLIFFIALHLLFLRVGWLSFKHKRAAWGVNMGGELVIFVCLSFYMIEANFYTNFGVFAFLSAFIGCTAQRVDVLERRFFGSL